MAQPFKHGLQARDIDKLNGWIKCMSEIQNHISEVTQENPEKRFIDSVPLMERIIATIKEFEPMLNQAQAELSQLASKIKLQ